MVIGYWSRFNDSLGSKYMHSGAKIYFPRRNFHKHTKIIGLAVKFSNCLQGERCVYCWPYVSEQLRTSRWLVLGGMHLFFYTKSIDFTLVGYINLKSYLYWLAMLRCHSDMAHSTHIIISYLLEIEDHHIHAKIIVTDRCLQKSGTYEPPFSFHMESLNDLLSVSFSNKWIIVSIFSLSTGSAFMKNDSHRIINSTCPHYWLVVLGRRLEMVRSNHINISCLLEAEDHHIDTTIVVIDCRLQNIATYEPPISFHRKFEWLAVR